jgi:hypothetical protein
MHTWQRAKTGKPTPKFQVGELVVATWCDQPMCVFRVDDVNVKPDWSYYATTPWRVTYMLWNVFSLLPIDHSNKPTTPVPPDEVAFLEEDELTRFNIVDLAAVRQRIDVFLNEVVKESSE